MGIKHKPVSICRQIYEQNNSKIPDGFVIRHTCDNPSCINPKHLLVGTQQENIKDRDSRNRNAKGERIHLAKLTEDIVKKIRIDKTSTGSELGKIYGVAKSTIYCVKSRTTWKHI